VIELTDQPWWSVADQAELDVVVHELVRVAFVHRERCSVCSAGGSCRAMGEAIAAAIEWRDGRVLRSKAEWLRIRQRARVELDAA
jgi:hypothetical protein